MTLAPSAFASQWNGPSAFASQWNGPSALASQWDGTVGRKFLECSGTGSEALKFVSRTSIIEEPLQSLLFDSRIGFPAALSTQIWANG